MREARSDEAFFIGDDLPVDGRQWRGAPGDGTRMRKWGCEKTKKILHASFFTNKQSNVYLLRYVYQSFRAQRSAPHSAALVDGGLL